MTQDERYANIMRRLSEHLDAVKYGHPEWVGIFLQGSQNYELDYGGSDIDTKLIVLPTFEDFALNRKPVSYTHVMENDEHVDVKDIRLMFDCFRKQNINFVEVLFTPYRILNPKYTTLFQPVIDARERIGRYNDFAALNCMVGMALEKQKALCHPYPTTAWKIEKFGYDSKQWHHVLRMQDFMLRWMDGEPYVDCLIPKQRDLLLAIKKYEYGDLKSAIDGCNNAVSYMKNIKDAYMLANQPTIDRGVDEILNTALVELFRKNFLSEIQYDKEKAT